MDVPQLPTSDQLIRRLLRAVREHLDLDVAFVGEVRDGERVFRHVDARPGVDAVSVGDADPLEESYCGHVLSGELPELLGDPRRHPLAASLPVTWELPVGTHLSVPIEFSDGRVYGTFCCFSRDVDASLDLESLKPLRIAAELTAEYLEALDADESEQRRRRREIERVLADPEAMRVVFQPLCEVESMRPVALEALSRFPGSDRPPDWFFTEAGAVGLGAELEMRAVRLALAAFADVPAPMRLNVNVSPATLCSSAFFAALGSAPCERLVVEVTEHAAVDDWTELRSVSTQLAARGVRMAIDDVGMGFSGLNRILETSPHELKLDACVVRGVQDDLVKQALIESFCTFGRRAGLGVVAEGVETRAELETLRSLGVDLAQGYHLGRPQPVERLLAPEASLPLPVPGLSRRHPADAGCQNAL